MRFDCAKFEKHIVREPGGGCWTWRHTLNAQGYGVAWLGGRMQLVHRVLYQSHVGEIPHGLVLDHVCRVRCCVNPDHLEPVTQRENCARGDTGKHNSSRTHCKHGHALSGDNLIIRKSRAYDGHRDCRECHKVAGRKYYAKWKESQCPA